MGKLPDYEQLGSFYLGKKFELHGRRLLDEKLLYDSKDLTTHALCVGMTGSGKTGLCLSLLEEAAVDGIPAICIDPKGDLGNLLLAFPDLASGDFEPWVDPDEAARKGLEVEQYAQQTAEKWRSGLESWDQDADRVKRFRDAVDIAIYTPGSNAGIPMTVLKSFDAPPQAVIDDGEIMRERISGAASGLLTLMGMEADPLSSREHILLSNIFDINWRKGISLDLPAVIRAIQSPPLEKVGVFDLESFFPAAERMKLSISLNNLLASPTFAGWLEGQALDIRSLMYTASGQPRISIISIAHLSDTERMFFVTILLNELLAWMRTQPGTNSLRALFYMDEVFGYFPPSAKPPSKPPMLVLLKQARAFGLGIVLATQNPVDLDYKGLSNIGTWFLGRLQTQRDKDRVLDGLEGAASQTGTRFDRAAMEQTLAALGSRVFLMNNVHDDGPTIFQTRWALSYLRGPLSRTQISTLMGDRRQELLAASPASPDETSHAEAMPDSAPAGSNRPIISHGIEECFWAVSVPPAKGDRLLYRPALLAQAACHYVRSSADVEHWFDRALLYVVNRGRPHDLWRESVELPEFSVELSTEPEEGFFFDECPADLLNAKNYKRWEKDLRDHIYRHLTLRVYKCLELKRYSAPGLDELDARNAWLQAVREKRDEMKESLQASLASKIRALESKVNTARQRIERETAQYDKEKWNTVMNFGQTLLGAIMGNKISSKSATAGRSLTRAAQQRADVSQANQTLESLEREKRELEFECNAQIKELQDKYSISSLTLEPLDIPCRKGDMDIKRLALIWIPWSVTPQGIATPLVPLPKISPRAINR
ncbi:ATP-binding protein [Aureliella helgolandensis]|uniref:AAA-like domain protein n=1 Tax=Aureliella helgolandensis TaxID=2527968 RepID=A0A518G8C0_9BACT|nr:helicase HerA-like domain-containing protein [Aureliella helgolandensis]QDV24842.1 AAA-like domain protein [Aureliella helgolandensis]